MNWGFGLCGLGAGGIGSGLSHRFVFPANRFPRFLAGRDSVRTHTQLRCTESSNEVDERKAHEEPHERRHSTYCISYKSHG